MGTFNALWHRLLKADRLGHGYFILVKVKEGIRKLMDFIHDLILMQGCTVTPQIGNLFGQV